MKNVLGMLAILAIAGCKPGPEQTQAEQPTTTDTAAATALQVPTISRAWETTPELTTAESVLYDEANHLCYVSCIGGVPPTAKDKDGFIAMISTDGKIITEKWITGLNAPKGMGLVGTTLYVTDIDRLVAIDTKTGKIIKEYPVKGSEFLNDVATSPEGVVYFTDSNTSTVYRLEQDEVHAIKADTSMGGTNGVCFDNGRLCLATFGSGQVIQMDLTSTNVSKMAEGIPAGDGIERFGHGFLVSNWNGEVYYLGDDGKVTELLDTREANLNAADIEVIPGQNLLLVPTFFGNTVTAYNLTIPQ